MGDDVQDVLQVQQIERALRRAIEVVSHPVWEQEWDGMFQREELIEELEELAKRPRDLLAAKNQGRAGWDLAKRREGRLYEMGRDLAQKKQSLEVAEAEIAELKAGRATGRSEDRPLQDRPLQEGEDHARE